MYVCISLSPYFPLSLSHCLSPSRFLSIDIYIERDSDWPVFLPE